jgi:hypothetical protein
MIYIKVKINKFISNDQPGFVNCSFTDIHNKDWSFTEKIPIVTKEIIDENTTLPKDGFIAGEIIKQ